MRLKLAQVFIVQITISFLGAYALAADFTYPLAKGLYRYAAVQGQNIRALKLIQTRTVVNDEGLVSDLKKRGYVCIRSNEQKRICRLTTNNAKVTDDVIATVDNSFAGFEIEFGASQNPILEIDTSQTQEWTLVQDVRINSTKISRTKYVHYWNENLNRIIFPVSEDQGIPWVNIVDSKAVALEFQVRSQKPDEIWSWFLTADLKLVP